ncbi:MAG: hypothetical protein RL398_1077, partial [Planctomycetota bacterium]
IAMAVLDRRHRRELAAIDAAENAS